MEEALRSIADCVTNMRNTNTFMLMSINRCIDYTKVSRGVKLSPKFETIDLLDALHLPLKCMRDIQHRTTIDLMPMSKDICSHVITDKQWFQENILCLLSNAVKYSNGGHVTVTITKEVICAEDERLCGGDTTAVEGMKSATRFKTSQVRPMVSTSMASLQSFRLSEVPAQHVSNELSSYHDDVSLHRLEVVKVQVEDQGIGLSKEAMATLFHPFRQAQRLAGGTGLGLFSLARRVEVLRGKCGVSNRVDGKQGSCFWFYFPYLPDHQASDLAAAVGKVDHRVSSMMVPVPKELSVRTHSIDMCTTEDIAATNKCALSVELCSPAHMESRKKLKILVVDDSPTILKMISMMLKREKHDVITATNGAEALHHMEALGSEPANGDALAPSPSPHIVDVILMDLQMPVMDGLEATKRIRQLEGVLLHHLIIGVSANSDSETEREALAAGMDSFMRKPFTLENFYLTYRKIKKATTNNPHFDIISSE